MLQKKGTQNIESFQGIRAYAFMLIFTSHCSIPLFSNFLGPMGVSIFIILSGYLAMRQYDLNIYRVNYRKKLKKFMPLHWFTLVMAIPLNAYLLCGADKLKTIGILCLNALCLHGWIPVREVFFSFNFVSWYLCVNFLFLLIGGMICGFLFRMERKGNLLYFIGGVFAIQILLAQFVKEEEFSHWLLYICPAVRCLDFSFGGGDLSYAA